MDVQCHTCHKTIAIPDEKIPQTASFSFTCPYCKERVHVKETTPSANLPLSDSEPENLAETSLPAFETDTSVSPDPIPPGTKAAFIFVNDVSWRKGAENFFGSKGYYLVLPESLEEARLKLYLQSHHVILIQDNEDCESLWEIIHSWRGLDRRECNVISLCKDVASMAPDEAFLQGVNACLSLSDKERLDELLEYCLNEHEQTLLPWKQARKEEIVKR